MTLVSVDLAGRDGSRGDPARLSAQVVAGIGFLGAGAIIRDGGSIRGLTTAASIWMTAMLGIAVGASPATGALAVVATGIAVLVLWWLHGVEHWMAARGLRQESIEIHIREDASATAEVLACLVTHGMTIRGGETDASRDGSRRRMTVRGSLPDGPERDRLLSELSALDGVRSASLE